MICWGDLAVQRWGVTGWPSTRSAYRTQPGERTGPRSAPHSGFLLLSVTCEEFGAPRPCHLGSRLTSLGACGRSLARCPPGIPAACALDGKMALLVGPERVEWKVKTGMAGPPEENELREAATRQRPRALLHAATTLPLPPAVLRWSVSNRAHPFRSPAGSEQPAAAHLLG